MIQVLTITPTQVCPICGRDTREAGHRLCVAELAVNVDDGLTMIANWTDPLPGEFRALRPYIAKQLDRSTICVHSFGYCTTTYRMENPQP